MPSHPPASLKGENSSPRPSQRGPGRQASGSVSPHDLCPSPTTKYFLIRDKIAGETALREASPRDMNLYKIEQLKAEALARCKKRLDMHGKTDVVIQTSLPVSASLRRKHGL